ncbi:hypothetical protein EON64_16030, partial [archaeon]
MGETFATPKSFEKEATAAIERIGNIKSLLVQHWSPGATPHPSFDTKKALYYLDSISNELCCIIDAAEACRNLHTHPAYLEASQDAFNTMNAFINELNQDQELYSVISHLFSLKDTLQLCEEERIFLQDLQSDFNSSGVHLPPPQQQEVLKLALKIGELERKFIGHVISHDYQRVPFGPLPTRDYAHWRQVIDQHYP